MGKGYGLRREGGYGRKGGLTVDTGDEYAPESAPASATGGLGGGSGWTAAGQGKQIYSCSERGGESFENLARFDEWCCGDGVLSTHQTCQLPLFHPRRRILHQYRQLSRSQEERAHLLTSLLVSSSSPSMLDFSASMPMFS